MDAFYLFQFIFNYIIGDYVMGYFFGIVFGLIAGGVIAFFVIRNNKNKYEDAVNKYNKYVKK